MKQVAALVLSIILAVLVIPILFLVNALLPEDKFDLY